MRRELGRSCVTLILGMLVDAGHARAGADEEKLPRALTASQLQQKLQQAVSVPGFEPNTPLREALGFLAEHFGLTILIDGQAFKDELQINEPEQQPVKL